MRRHAKDATFDQRLGPHRWRFGEQEGWTEFVIEDQHVNIHGVAHGGVVYSLIDTGMGLYVERHLAHGARTATATITIHYLEPVPLGRIRVSIQAVRVGGRLAVLEATVSRREERHRTLVRAIGLYPMLRPKSQEGC